MKQQVRPASTRSAMAIVLVAVALQSVACAPKMAPTFVGRPTGYDRLEEAGATAEGYESAADAVETADAVPPDLREGPHHRVRSVRLDHRFLYTYELDSDFGELEVVGRGLLRKRVSELDALAQSPPSWLDGMKIFALEVANAAAEPVEGVLQILRHPVRTLVNVPRGVVVSFKAAREMTRTARTHFEDDYYLEFLGLSGRKREWAQQLAVDPYTTNPLVQKRLTRNGLLSLAGQATVQLATIPITAGAATITMAVLGMTSGMNQQVRDISPEDVRVDVRSRLRDELGIDGELAESFVEHPWYPPSRQQTIVDALDRMERTAGRERLIELAVHADEPHEAYAFSRLALMFAEFHQRTAPIEELVTRRDLLLGRTGTDAFVIPLYMDFLYWTAEVDEVEAALRADLGRGGREEDRVLLVSGQLSPRAAEELEARGWRVVVGLEDLWLTELDRRRHEPTAETDARILPRLGR